MYRDLNLAYADGDSSISIEFDSLQREFSDTSRVSVLYSRVRYRNRDFSWDSVLPTVRIPYRDPAFGMMLGGVVFSSVGIYQRAPGVFLSREKEDDETSDSQIIIVTARNSTITIGYRRGGVQIGFTKRRKTRYVPIGVFLKAITGAPYKVILQRFVFKPPVLRCSFPCEVPTKAVDLARVAGFGDSAEEPTVEECIDAVYGAIVQSDPKAKTHYSSHWKLNRIQAYLSGLHFKTVQNYESNLAVHSRAKGMYLDQDVCLPIYDENGTQTEFKLHRGTFISDEIAGKLQWYDLPVLRVKSSRYFLISEDTPVFFRALGYKLADDIEEFGFKAGEVITRDHLKKLNSSDIYNLSVFTPEGRKVLVRGGDAPCPGDFFTILNTLFTANFREYSTSSQYEIANRIVIDYDRQVRLEIEQTYNDIVSAIMGCASLASLLESLPKLPSTALESHFRDSDSKELSQAEITNVLSRAIAEKRASALMASTPAAMTAVQKGQYGRIDSLHAPESDKVGSVQEITSMARVNPETCELEAPYEKVVDGKPTGVIEYISAAKESGKYIVGWDDNLAEDVVMARCDGDVTTVPRSRVDYRDVSPFCDMSVSRQLIPFPEFSQPRRSLMATKMAGQAVPVLFPERPLVSTGADTEIPCLYYTARDIVVSSLGKDAVQTSSTLELVSVRWTHNFATYNCVYGGRAFVYAVPFTATDKETLYNYNLNYKEGYTYNLDDIVFYNQSCDIRDYELYEKMAQGSMPLVKDPHKPSLALGVNLKVIVKTYSSSTIEDAVVISDRLVGNRKLSHIQIFKYSYTLKGDETFGARAGTAAIHSYVYNKQPVITYIRTDKRGNHSTRNIYCKQAGEVIYSEIISNEKETTAEVWVATIHDATEGDKVAGRHGNKSIIARIIPEHDMPYDPETGESADIIISPLGIPSRMNLGQVVELTMGAVMEKQGKHAVVTPFYPGIKQEVQKLYESEGLCMKRLFNPLYGKLTERPVMMGNMYFLKLEQMSNLKWSAVGYPTAVDPVFGQPVSSSNASKGQSAEEMITWALAAAGSNKILNSLFTVYSSDELSRTRYFSMLEENPDDGDSTWDEAMKAAQVYRRENKDALVTSTIMRMFGLDLIVPEDSDSEDRYELVPFDLNNILISITPLQLKNHSEPVESNEWCKVPLRAPVVNPYWIECFPLKDILGIKSVKTLVTGSYSLNVYTKEIKPTSQVLDFERSNMITGIDAVIALLSNTTIDEAIARIKNSGQSQTAKSEVDNMEDNAVITGEIVNLEEPEEDLYVGDVPVDNASIVRFLLRMQRHGLELKDLIWNEMPIMPQMFRQSDILRGRENEHSFQKQLRHICDCSKSSDIYEALRTFIGYGETNNSDLISIRGYFFGKGASSGQHGTVRGNVLSKRVGFSGRSVIAPASDPTMSPYFIGVPWCIAMIELSKILAIRIKKRASEIERRVDPYLGRPLRLSGFKSAELETIIESLAEFNPYIFKKYFDDFDYSDQLFIFNSLREEVRSICEDNVTPDGRVRVGDEYLCPEEIPDSVTIDAAVVQTGRQPTLHKKSIRVFFMKLVDGYCLRIHPVVCGGFNADFDGDTMYNIQMLGEMKNDGWRTVSVLQDLISEKDGSYTLGLSQDIALGLYCATLFKDNAKEYCGARGAYHFFDSADELEFSLEYGDLHYYDCVVYFDKQQQSYYISTAGRVLINARVPGSFTKVPFQDKWGICEQVLGPEAKSQFCELRYDTVLVSTGIRPEGRNYGTKVEKILLDVYDTFGARSSVDTTQALYEIGLAASDIFSVSMSMDDMSVDVDVSSFMHEPKEYVAKLNNLEQLGLISKEERKSAAVRAWERARKSAMSAVIAAIPENSSTYLMMYSGARGKPEQTMQSVGFIGTISKTKTEDIEYPILTSYGAGLTTLDLARACYMARIGVVSTQAGTKDTGYATRQTVYMVSGMCVQEEDCGIDWHEVDVPYSTTNVEVRLPDGSKGDADILVGQFVDPAADLDSTWSKILARTGYIITQDLAEMIILNGVTEISLLEGPCTISYRISDEWRQEALAGGYSYALPYTGSDRKITEQSIDWVEHHGLTRIIMFDEDQNAEDKCFNREAYLPVDYDASDFELYVGDDVVVEESLFGKEIAVDSPGYHYYCRLLSDNRLSVKALQYLTKKKVRSIVFADGREVSIRYKLTPLFQQLVLGRLSTSLPFLDADGAITEDTLKEVQRVQLEYIPVRTTLTCLTVSGVCSCCNGKSPSTRKYATVGSNLGIPAAQAQCEPLSQATLNVNHSGGKRGAGVGLVSGLEYYLRLLQGKTSLAKTQHLVEEFADVSGYVSKDVHNPHFFRVTDEDGHVLKSYEVDNVDRINVPNGAYIDKGDTIKAGLTQLNRYSGRDIFKSCLYTRYLLLREYHNIFKALNVSARNYEILARAQTSICYLVEPANLPATEDTSTESLRQTGKYELRVATQSEVVNKYSGIAGFAFEKVATMLMDAVLGQGPRLNSVLGNLVTGTPVGSTKADFIPPVYGALNKSYRMTAVKKTEKRMKALAQEHSDAALLGIGNTAEQHVDSIEALNGSLLDRLFELDSSLGSGEDVKHIAFLDMPELGAAPERDESSATEDAISVFDSFIAEPSEDYETIDDYETVDDQYSSSSEESVKNGGVSSINLD